jgi:hypothetical protein
MGGRPLPTSPLLGPMPGRPGAGLPREDDAGGDVDGVPDREEVAGGDVDGGLDREVLPAGRPWGSPVLSWPEGQAGAFWAHPWPTLDRLVVVCRWRAGVTVVPPVVALAPPAPGVVPTGEGP